jgi:hypothetical protein
MRSSPSPTAEDGSTVTATLAVKVIMNTIPKKHQKSEPVGGSTGIIIPTLGGSDLLNYCIAIMEHLYRSFGLLDNPRSMVDFPSYELPFRGQEPLVP